MKKRILFVCMGNICRSPAAEGILRSKAEKAGLAEHYAIDSAGTYSGHSGDLPDPRMREAAQRRGYRLTHRARPVLDEDFSRFDMLIAMDERNYDALDRLAFTLEDKAKIYRMTDFSSRHDYDHVPDPYYEGREGFELVLDLLEDACTGMLQRDGILTETRRHKREQIPAASEPKRPTSHTAPLSTGKRPAPSAISIFHHSYRGRCFEPHQCKTTCTPAGRCTYPTPLRIARH